MTNVIDFATRQPFPEAAFKLSASELAAFAVAHEGPDFIKRKGVMVITPETQENTDRLFEVFGLGIRSGGDPERQLNTWAWLGAPVAIALKWHGTEYFENLIRPLRPPAFVDYVLALAEGNKAAASVAARQLGVYDGLESSHPQAKLLSL